MGRVKIIKHTDTSVELEVEGEDHTLCNVLCKELFNDKHVIYAAYHIDHPLVGKPKIYVETDGSKDPIKAIIEASERIKANALKFKELFLKALESAGES
ncbi:MAG: DNA-directed RNA polymerase subunit L [Candidatus Methanomethylicota archaeon]|uniref:DNA-directed RNA polymerase subunit Rpo11 n=1 Tax=Thermoproteota archaeon TaxID=2056631 RepID=A0A497EUX0_9CREN|nr:MAG: DNA-directed RNA polymerase subunit L [Candidatus Verstraetearchaeota archaeon]